MYFWLSKKQSSEFKRNTPGWCLLCLCWLAWVLVPLTWLSTNGGYLLQFFTSRSIWILSFLLRSSITFSLLIPPGMPLCRYDTLAIHLYPLPYLVLWIMVLRITFWVPHVSPIWSGQALPIPTHPLARNRPTSLSVNCLLPTLLFTWTWTASQCWSGRAIEHFWPAFHNACLHILTWGGPLLLLTITLPTLPYLRVAICLLC